MYVWYAKCSTKWWLWMSSRGGHSWDFSDCWFSGSAPRWTARHSRLLNLVAATAKRKRATKAGQVGVSCGPFFGGCRMLRACLVDALATRCPLVLGQDGQKWRKLNATKVCWTATTFCLGLPECTSKRQPSFLTFYPQFRVRLPRFKRRSTWPAPPGLVENLRPFRWHCVPWKKTVGKPQLLLINYYIHNSSK